MVLPKSYSVQKLLSKKLMRSGLESSVVSTQIFEAQLTYMGCNFDGFIKKINCQRLGLNAEYISQWVPVRR